MRLLQTASLLLTLLASSASAQTPSVSVSSPRGGAPPAVTPPPRTTASSATISAAPTAPTVGVIDFYGLNKVTRDRVRKTLDFKEGDPFPSSKANVEERLDAIPGVVESHLEAVCCDEGKMVLYVGIEERGAVHFDLREAPEGEVMLAPEIVALYRRYFDAFQEAVRRKSTAEDLTRGHALMADPLAREIQLEFPDVAEKNLGDLHNVLHNSADDEQRAIATLLIGYAPKKDQVADDLQFALRDADPGVRANAARAIVALAVYARLHADSGIKLQPTWFVEMLNSLSWSDRQRALSALQILTDGRDAQMLDQLRNRALPALIEMSRWKTLQHALPAFVLTGRVAGLSEQQIQDAWTRGDRESVIAAVMGGGKKSR
ncbi:MAG: hypothetical protein ABI833_18110 [Acidobacteriota bacterium]